MTGPCPRWGPPFDEFVARAASGWYFVNPPKNQYGRRSLVNRALLHFVMTAAGFVAHPEEWWHSSGVRNAGQPPPVALWCFDRVLKVPATAESVA